MVVVFLALWPMAGVRLASAPASADAATQTGRAAPALGKQTTSALLWDARGTRRLTGSSGEAPLLQVPAAVPWRCSEKSPLPVGSARRGPRLGGRWRCVHRL